MRRRLGYLGKSSYLLKKCGFLENGFFIGHVVRTLLFSIRFCLREAGPKSSSSLAIDYSKVLSSSSLVEGGLVSAYTFP